MTCEYTLSMIVPCTTAAQSEALFRMYAKSGLCYCVTICVLVQVPCVAVVENMSYFEVDGVRHLPFGAGSGDRIVQDFGLPNLIRFPIVADLSLAGDGQPPSTPQTLCFQV